MKRFWLGVAAAVVMSGCGGDVFTNTETTDPPTTTDPTVPEAIAGDVTSVEYNSSNQSLIVRGTGLDNTPFEAAYTRNTALDVPGYEAYTTQSSSLDRHFTALVRERDGVYAAVVGGGPQFNSVIMGSAFGRNGTFSAPATTPTGSGLVSYAGNYAGVLNGAETGTDLAPVAPGTPANVLPEQIARITGAVFINADFADNAVNGIVYDRTLVNNGASLEDLTLFVGDIDANGNFKGEVREGGLRTIGEYAGVFGGTDASALAGGLTASDHISAADNAIEFGVFVLAQCGTADADPICNQPRP